MELTFLKTFRCCDLWFDVRVLLSYFMVSVLVSLFKHLMDLEILVWHKTNRHLNKLDLLLQDRDCIDSVTFTLTGI